MDKKIYGMPLLIGVTSDINLENLERMMMNHITHYIFSNIDYLGNNIDISYFPEKIFEKIVTTRRGICLDLNYSFSLFLTSQGYENYMVKCFRPGSRSEKRNVFHLGIIAILDNRKYFVDVGYGDYFTKPLLLTGIVRHRLYVRKTPLNIIDLTITIEDISDNYLKIAKTKPDDLALRNVKYERIYDIHMEEYVIPTLSKF